MAALQINPFPLIALDSETDRQINEVLNSLPHLTEEQVVSLGHGDSLCPICFMPLRAILTEEEMAQAMESPAHPLEELGVTQLVDTCRHIFCRKDISKWIREGHHSCPTCRRPFFTPDPEARQQIEGSTEEDILAVLQAVLDRAPQSFNGLQLLVGGPHSQNDGVAVEDSRDEYAGMYS